MDGSEANDWIVKFCQELEAAKRELNVLDQRVTGYYIQVALVEVLGLPDTTKLLYRDDLSAEDIITHLQGFEFDKFFPEELERVTLNFSIIPEGVPTYLFEQTIRSKGEVWVIHKNDADPFPSNPHAHNYDKGLVLHLGTGNLYRYKKVVGKLRKKNLIILRNLIKTSELPTLEL